MSTVLVCYNFHKCITEKSDVVRWDGVLEALRMDFSSTVTGYGERHKRTCAWRGSILAALSILSCLIEDILTLCTLVLLRWTGSGRLFDKLSPFPKGTNKKGKRNRKVTLLWDTDSRCAGNEYLRASGIQDTNIQTNEWYLHKHPIKWTLAHSK